MSDRRSIGVVLFDGFELLDVFGPLEMYGIAADHFDICLVEEQAGSVTSRQGPRSVIDCSFSEAPQFDILFVPRGIGTRTEINNQTLVARAGLLDGMRATINKLAFEWVASQSSRVNWQRQARWVEDGNVFTSSGVSAGIDMSLAVIARLVDQETAEKTATWAEYDWHRDADWDPFAKLQGMSKALSSC